MRLPDLWPIGGDRAGGSGLRQLQRLSRIDAMRIADRVLVGRIDRGVACALTIDMAGGPPPAACPADHPGVPLAARPTRWQGEPPRDAGRDGPRRGPPRHSPLPPPAPRAGGARPR